MSDVDNLLTCAVCLQWFRSPRRLSCTHVYCLQCLRGLVIPGRNFITCPECRCRHEITNGRVEDFLIDGRIEQFMENKKEPEGDWCKDCQQEPSIGECEHCHLLACLQCQTNHRSRLVTSLIEDWNQSHNDYFSDHQMAAREKQKNELLRHKENIEAFKMSFNREIDDMKIALENRRLTLMKISEKKEQLITDELLKLEKAEAMYAPCKSYLTRLAETSAFMKGVVSMKEELDEQLRFVASLHSGHVIKKVTCITFKKKRELLELIDNYGQICNVPYYVDYRNDCTLIKTIDGAASGSAFVRPTGLTVCPFTDNMYVTDDSTIRVYDSDGEYIRHVVTNESYNGIVIDSNRRVIVTNWMDNVVKIYSLELDLIKCFGSGGELNGQFRMLRGVTCDQDDNIYVVDYCNQNVQVFAPDGTFQSVIGSGTLRQPWYVQINQRQEVMVTNSNRVDIFHKDGTYLRSITGHGDYTLKKPRGICLDATGHILVFDNGSKKIEVYTISGRHYCTIDKPAASMKGVRCLAVTSSGGIFITNNSGKIHLIASA